MSVTLAQIAKGVGVSKQAVSYALNDRPGKVSEEMRRKILEVARQMNYQPNWTARALTRRRSNAIGLVYSREVDYVESSQLVTSLVERMTELDLNLMLIPAIGPLEEWSSKLRDGRVDGCLVTYPMPLDLDKFIATHEVPAALINLECAKGLPCVIFDDFDGASKATRHLLELGHERIEFVYRPRASGEHYSLRERLRGYEETYRAAGYEPRSSVMSPAEWADRIAGMPADSRPSAAVVYNDSDAFKLIRELQARSLQVPREISLIGFNDSPMCELSHPPLTSVRPDWQAAAAQALKLVLDTLDDTTPTPSDQDRCVISEFLEVRASVADRRA